MEKWKWFWRFLIVLLGMGLLTVGFIMGGAYGVMYAIEKTSLTEEWINKAIVLGILLARMLACLCGGIWLRPQRRAFLWGLLLGLVYVVMVLAVGGIFWGGLHRTWDFPASVPGIFAAMGSAVIGVKIRKKHFSEER